MKDDPSIDAASLKPFSEAEVELAMGRLLASPMMEFVRQAYFKGKSPAELAASGAGVHGWHDFQERFIAPAIDSILAQSSDGFSIAGLDRLKKGRKVVFVSNHRDIVCDPALFTYGLHRGGWESPYICLGDNLLVNPWVVDLVKMNRGVTVKRGLSPRELLRWSHALSRLIRDAVAKDVASVRIAQREGRAKDGNDETHPGVLKMLALSSDEPVLDALDRLNLTPVAVSYEYDPCDALKARELYRTETQGAYQKEPGEDVKSMALGIQGYKGRVHIEVGDPLSSADAGARELGSRKEQLARLALALDSRISRLYRRFPSAFIARDLLQAGGAPGAGPDYTAEERARFEARLAKQLDSVGAREPEERAGVRRHLLGMYARALEARA